MSNRLKIGQEVLIHGYVDEIRKDTIIIQNEGGYFGTVECEVTDIEMPDTNKVLDKIRAEIEQVKSIMNEEIIDHNRKDLINFVNGLNQSLVIIDKYNSESEDKE